MDLKAVLSTRFTNLMELSSIYELLGVHLYCSIVLILWSGLQFEGYKFDPNGEYVRRRLPELARLPTEWIHHPWNAPESVLQAAGVELGSNYPLPMVEIDAVKAGLQEALSEMWQQEVASRATIENGTEEGLGDSSESPLIDFPQEIQMEVDPEPVRINATTAAAARRYEDQMVPSMTISSLRVEDEEERSSNARTSSEDSRPEVPSNMNTTDPHNEVTYHGGLPTVRNNPLQFNEVVGPQNAVLSTAESSSGGRERDGGVVPVWSPATSSHSEQYMGEETGFAGSSTYLQRHAQSHQLMNWRRLSQTG